MSDTYYKVLAEDGSCIHGGSGRWPLPTQNDDGIWMPGEWLSVKGKIKFGTNGLHLTGLLGLVGLVGPAVFEAEPHPDEDVIRGSYGEKVVTRRARLLRPLAGWDRRYLKLFFLDCAERVIDVYAFARPGDTRLSSAVELARLSLVDDAPAGALDTAWDRSYGAYALVEGAARDAAEAVRGAVQVCMDRDDRYSSVLSAAERSRMTIQARREETRWQRERLQTYVEGLVR